MGKNIENIEEQVTRLIAEGFLKDGDELRKKISNLPQEILDNKSGDYYIIPNYKKTGSYVDAIQKILLINDLLINNCLSIEELNKIKNYGNEPKNDFYIVRLEKKISNKSLTTINQNVSKPTEKCLNLFEILIIIFLNKKLLDQFGTIDSCDIIKKSRQIEQYSKIGDIYRKKIYFKCNTFLQINGEKLTLGIGESKDLDHSHGFVIAEIIEIS